MKGWEHSFHHGKRRKNNAIQALLNQRKFDVNYSKVGDQGLFTFYKKQEEKQQQNSHLLEAQSHQSKDTDINNQKRKKLKLKKNSSRAKTQDIQSNYPQMTVSQKFLLHVIKDSKNIKHITDYHEKYSQQGVDNKKCNQIKQILQPSEQQLSQNCFKRYPFQQQKELCISNNKQKKVQSKKKINKEYQSPQKYKKAQPNSLNQQSFKKNLKIQSDNILQKQLVQQMNSLHQINKQQLIRYSNNPFHALVPDNVQDRNMLKNNLQVERSLKQQKLFDHKKNKKKIQRYYQSSLVTPKNQKQLRTRQYLQPNLICFDDSYEDVKLDDRQSNAQKKPIKMALRALSIPILLNLKKQKDYLRKDKKQPYTVRLPQNINSTILSTLDCPPVTPKNSVYRHLKSKIKEAAQESLRKSPKNYKIYTQKDESLEIIKKILSKKLIDNTPYDFISNQKDYSLTPKNQINFTNFYRIQSELKLSNTPKITYKSEMSQLEQNLKAERVFYQKRTKNK